MQTPYDLRQLAALRRNGQSPTLPVFVTNNWILLVNMQKCGALAIRVRPENSAENWEPVAGLEVIVAVPPDEDWKPLVEALRQSRPRRLEYLSKRGLVDL